MSHNDLWRDLRAAERVAGAAYPSSTTLNVVSVGQHDMRNVSDVVRSDISYTPLTAEGRHEALLCGDNVQVSGDTRPTYMCRCGETIYVGMEARHEAKDHDEDSDEALAFEYAGEGDDLMDGGDIVARLMDGWDFSRMSQFAAEFPELGTCSACGVAGKYGVQHLGCAGMFA